MKQTIAIVGCGAISELYYGPALSELQRLGEVEVVGILDPDAKRMATLQAQFPAARALDQLPALAALQPSLAVVASPPRFHAAQTVALLRAGIPVLCEKPMATSVLEAQAMVDAAREAHRILAIGLFRRFYPTSQAIGDLVRRQQLGRVLTFEIFAGGQFRWPAQSASFFQKSGSQGGVLADLGIHVLDLLLWWFGYPETIQYEDDAMGGLEANCRVTLGFAGGIRGVVRLSRDTDILTGARLVCERGWVRWHPDSANELEMGHDQAPFVFRSQLAQALPGQRRVPAATYHQSFVWQLKNVLQAVRGEATLVIDGEAGLQSLRLVEECYARKTLLPHPWLSPVEQRRAAQLAGVAA